MGGSGLYQRQHAGAGRTSDVSGPTIEDRPPVNRLCADVRVPVEEDPVMNRNKKRYGGSRWTFALTILVCFTAFIGGGSLAYGGRSAGSNDPPRPGWPQPPQSQAFAADFCLSSIQTDTGSVNGASAGHITFSLQQQPFAEPAVRLRNDDPEYNKKSPLRSVGLRVLSANVVVWGIDRFIFNYPWSHIGPASWKHNLKTGWEWDTDRLGMNYFFHRYSGAAYFNAARSNGYTYAQSVPFAFLGSLMWEYFGETTLPLNNDIINTTASGALFGEILFRLTSNILDDRRTGMERFVREFAAAILSPGRAFGRLLQGKLTKVTPREVYQKEPHNVTLYLGGACVQ